MAQELLDKEYRTPSRALQCSKERDACRDCYQGNAAQPLACAAAVDAFTRCADTALRVRRDVHCIGEELTGCSVQACDSVAA